MFPFRAAPTRAPRQIVFGFALLACVIALLLPRPVSAQVYSLNEGGFTLNLGIKGAVGGVATGNTNFGAGTVRPDGDVHHDVSYGEAFLLPKIDLSYDTGSYGTPYGGVAGVAAMSRGGDPGNFVPESRWDVDLDQLYAGWRSGKLLPSLGDDAVDISAGRQAFQIGDGFLIWDGHFDEHGDAAYWLAPRLAFDMTGIVKVDTKPVSGSVFYLEGDLHQDHAELAGLDLNYTNEKLGSTFGATYFQVFDADDAGSNRHGMNVADVRAWDIPVPFVSDLTLRGEFAYQWGRHNGIDINANGWYVSATYSFADLLPWKPALTYRYSFFSGDNPNDDNSNAFDPLFYDGPGTWGTWFQGEIVGEYLLFNSNEIAHMVQLEVSPTESLTLGFLFFDFSLDKKNYLGTPVSDTHFADEVNLYANWNVTDHIYLGIVGGLAWPGAAAKEVFGDETYQLIEGQMVVTY
jgi:hypothetical protein